MAEAAEEDWQRRQETRRAIVAAIKASPDYLALPASRRPGTPDSNDRMMSKRAWETKVVQWRHDLEELVRKWNEITRRHRELLKELQRRRAAEEAQERRRRELLQEVQSRRAAWEAEAMAAEEQEPPWKHARFSTQRQAFGAGSS